MNLPYTLPSSFTEAKDFDHFREHGQKSGDVTLYRTDTGSYDDHLVVIEGATYRVVTR